MSFSYTCVGSKPDRTRTLTVVNKITGQLSQVDDSVDSPIDMIMEMFKVGDDPSKIQQALNNVQNNLKNQADEMREAYGFFGDADTIELDGITVNKQTWETISSSTGANIKALRKFLSRLSKNPSGLVKVSLLEWINANKTMSITEDGLLIGYRAITAKRNSHHSGYGEILTPGASEWIEIAHAQLPNNTGNIVKMPRNMVDHDINNACSFGLHVGTWYYASTFGPPILTLALFDPADVVAVPTSDMSKIRVCRYLVGPDVDSKLKKFVVSKETITDDLGVDAFESFPATAEATTEEHNHE